MDEREIKECWKNSSDKEESINAMCAEEITGGKRKTALMRLALRYKRFFIAGLLFAALLPPMYLFNPGLEMSEGWKTGFAVYLAAFFLLGAVMDWVLYRKVDDINVISMTTQEVIDKAMACRRFHFRCIMILLPLVLVLIGVMLWQFFDDKVMVAVILVSLVVGLAIGLSKLSDFLRDYRSISGD